MLCQKQLCKQSFFYKKWDKILTLKHYALVGYDVMSFGKLLPTFRKAFCLHILSFRI